MKNNILPDQAWNVYKHSDCLFSEEDVRGMIDSVVSLVTNDLSELDPIIVCLLNGGVSFFSDLIKGLDFPLRTDYIHATRYGANMTGGELNWLAGPRQDPKGQHVLVVDDILDGGLTLEYIVNYYTGRGAASVRSAVLVVKDRPRKVDYMADYVGLHVPDRYVFGCGMDYKGYLRNLPGIYAEAEEK